MKLRTQLVQLGIIAVVQVVTLLLLAAWLTGLTIESPGSALLLALVFTLAQVVYWWVFIRFFSWLPVWLYPILTFVLSGALVMVAGNFISGVTIDGIGTGIWITVTLTAVNAVLGGILSLSLDERFDRLVTQQLVKRRGKPIQTDVPGFLYLEIDGLSEALFRRALDEGHMPTLKRWRDQGTHTICGWETDFSAQTGGMQPGILLGNNDEISAYRWWDRQANRIVASSSPRDLLVLEKQLSNGHGLLDNGGASRGNLYSGDASESLFTYSTMLDRARGRGPGFYTYLVSPSVVARLITRYFADVVREWWQAREQKRRKDKYMVSARTPWYAFFRALLGPLLQDLTTYTVISDMLRGVPAVYALYAGYDDLGHFAGMQSPEAFEMLAETDHYFARLAKALAYAPRPYHLIVLSDHGQSEGPTFEQAHGASLETLVKGLVKGEKLFADLDTNEAWDKVNVLLSESINADTRTAKVLQTMLASKTEDGVVAFGPDRSNEQQQQEKAQEAQIIVLASGCTGLIYVSGASQRLSYEDIQARYPDLILGLAMHPGIGWVLVRSRENGDMVLSEKGVRYLDKDEVEGQQDPLAVYGPNAAKHLKRESSFSTCPDLLVNTRYNPETQELCGFENQVSHHGGLGGWQNYPFIFYPITLPAVSQPIVGAPNVYRLLRGWRDTVQGEPAAATPQTAEALPAD